MSQITLSTIKKRYNDVDAVNGIDLTVEDGEFLVVVGPSGCGKSTLLRMIAGLETVTDGTIEIDGEIVNDRPASARDIAMVFQNYALYPHMSARENIRFGMEAASDDSADAIDQRIVDAADTLDIGDLLDRKPKELSGGERQRVAIGRALVREPSVFLLDEPLSNLDAKLRVQMRAELLQLHRQLDTTTVYVTHDQTEAMTLGDRVAVLKDGQLQQVATPQHLYDFPANRFVASFIGEPAMNLLPVAVRQRETGYVAEHEVFDLRLPVTDTLPDLIDQQVLLGIRPEDLAIADAPSSTDAFAATVRVREPLGESLLLHCDVGPHTLQVKTAPRQQITVDDCIRLTANKERLHLFDPDTGQALYHATQPAKRPEPTSG